MTNIFIFSKNAGTLLGCRFVSLFLCVSVAHVKINRLQWRQSQGYGGPGESELRSQRRRSGNRRLQVWIATSPRRWTNACSSQHTESLFAGVSASGEGVLGCSGDP